jgi:hypothetical protein
LLSLGIAGLSTGLGHNVELTMVQLAKQVLNEGWTYSLTDAHGAETGGVEVGEWTPVKAFPTTVHVELLKERKIPDPVSSQLPH